MILDGVSPAVIRHLLVVLLALAGTAASVAGSSPDAPTELRVIDSFSSLGIDTLAPRFGWVLHDDARGEIQTAYEIVVTADAGAVWESGKVASAQQYGVPYGGPALAKTSKYQWKVRTWNREDRASPWSADAHFVTAFFAPGDWAAGTRWIRHPQAVSRAIDPPPVFRKTFDIPKPVKHAYLYLSGLGQFVGFLNGSKIGDHEFDPAWTDYDQTVDYVTFDVTSQLRPGANALGVMLGTGWFANAGTRDFGPMKLWGQLHVDYADGTSAEIVTDSTWKVTGSPFTSIEVHGAENYDARLEQAGWDQAGFDDAGWLHAAEAAAPLGSLVAQNSPPVTVRQTLDPIHITQPASDVCLYDFGQNINGIYEITVQGPAGAQVRMLPAESLSNRRAKVRNTAGSTYTLKGGGPENWRLTFSSIGFRYLEIRNVSRDPGQTTLPCLLDAKAYFTYTASHATGSFQAADPRYNQIYQLSLNTVRSGLVSIHQDGPTFEKLGWQEVAWTMLPSGMYQFDLQNLYTKIARDLRDAQRTSGLAPNIAPDWFHHKTTPPEGKFDDSPAWGASMFMVPWLLYTQYGDSQVLRENYPPMQRYLTYLKTREQHNLITYGLGDWMAPAGSPVANVEGAVYVLDTQVMRDAAEALGQAADAKRYGDEYDRVRTAYNEAYFQPDTKSYSPMNQADQALPLAFGIVPSAETAAVARALVEDIARPREDGTPASYGKPGEFGPVLPDHVTTGDIGTTFLWRALGEAGQSDLVQKMIMQTDAPSYSNMIDSGETTVNENWNLAKARSHNHDMYAGILEWLYRYVGGISALEPGYAQIRLKPEIPAGLNGIALSYDSVRGRIQSAWTVKDDNASWEIVIPVNSTAKVYVPTLRADPAHLTIKESGTTIWQDGVPVSGDTGIAYDHTEGTAPAACVVWIVGSGSYNFAWTLPHPEGAAAGSH